MLCFPGTTPHSSVSRLITIEGDRYFNAANKQHASVSLLTIQQQLRDHTSALVVAIVININDGTAGLRTDAAARIKYKPHPRYSITHANRLNPHNSIPNSAEHAQKHVHVTRFPPRFFSDETTAHRFCVLIRRQRVASRSA